MKKEPINLLDVDADQFPVGGHMANALRAARTAFELIYPALEYLARHIGETEAGVNHDGTPVADDEMAYHHLAAEQLEQLFTALAKKCRMVDELGQRRLWTALTNRRSAGMIAFGKTFTAEGDLIGKQPKEDTPEYAELIAWCKARYPELVGQEYVGFQNMQKILEDLAAKKQPRPPHVEVSAKRGIKVGR